MENSLFADNRLASRKRMLYRLHVRLRSCYQGNSNGKLAVRENAQGKQVKVVAARDSVRTFRENARSA